MNKKEKTMLIKQMGLLLSELEQAVTNDRESVYTFIKLSKVVAEYEKTLAYPPTPVKETMMSDITVGNITGGVSGFEKLITEHIKK